MKYIAKVLIFLVNVIWYINVLLNWPLKNIVAIICVITTFSAIFGSGSGWAAFGWFMLLSFIMSFPALYQPKGFDE